MAAGTWSVWVGGVTMPAIAVGVGMGLLLAAAWQDFRTRLISDTICLVLAVFGILFRINIGLLDFVFSAITSLLLFFLLFAAFNRGILGGGDVKLIVATGLWLSPPDCYAFLAVTALAGGVLAVLHLGLRAVLRGKLGSTIALASKAADAGFSVGRVLRIEAERIRSGSPLPYGVAIAVGGCYALLMSLGG